jgi:hypothetical protein
MKKLFLTGIAALFLATGTARADDFVVLIQKDNENTSTAFVRMNMSCEEMLESHERNRKADTWLTYTPDREEPWRITWVGCLSAVSKIHCPPDHGRENAQG